MQGKSMLTPAVWGGLALGILSALPIVGAVNVCCCLWVITGGMLSAYVLQANTDEPISIGDGALTGLLSGLIGAVVYTVVSLPLSFMLGPVQQRAMQRLLDSVQDVPAEVRETFSNLGSAGITAVGLIMGFVMMLFVGAVFATLGGVLGAVFFKKKAVAGPEQPPDLPVGPFSA